MCLLALPARELGFWRLAAGKHLVLSGYPVQQAVLTDTAHLPPTTCSCVRAAYGQHKAHSAGRCARPSAGKHQGEVCLAGQRLQTC